MARKKITPKKKLVKKPKGGMAVVIAIGTVKPKTRKKVKK